MGRCRGGQARRDAGLRRRAHCGSPGGRVIRHPKAQILSGVIAMLACVVLVLTLGMRSPGLAMLALLPGICGILLVVFGALRLPSLRESGEAERGPVVL